MICMYVIYTYTYVYTYFNIYTTHTHLCGVFFPRASASSIPGLGTTTSGATPTVPRHPRIQQEIRISRLNHQLKNPKMEIFMGMFSVSKLGFFWKVSPSKKKGFLGTTHDWRWSIKHHGGWASAFTSNYQENWGYHGKIWEDFDDLKNQNHYINGINYMDIL